MDKPFPQRGAIWRCYGHFWVSFTSSAFAIARMVLPPILVLSLCSCSTVKRSEARLSGQYVLDGPDKNGSIFVFHEDGTFLSTGKQYKDWPLRGFGPGTYSIDHGTVELRLLDPRFSHMTQTFILKGSELITTNADRGNSMYIDGGRFIKQSESEDDGYALISGAIQRFGELRVAGQLPGLRRGEHGKLETDKLPDQPELEGMAFPISLVLHVTRDDQSRYDYTFIKDNPKSRWRLTGARQIGSDGQSKELKVE